MQDIPEPIRLTAEAVSDAGLPICDDCDGDGCRACARSGHDHEAVDHGCTCAGIGASADATAHYLLEVTEPWAADALEMIAEGHQPDRDGDCELCERAWPCPPAAVHLSTIDSEFDITDSPWSGDHTPYSDGECRTCRTVEL